MNKENKQKIIDALESIVDCLEKDDIQRPIDVQEQCWKNISNGQLKDDIELILRLPPMGYRLVTIDEMRLFYKPIRRIKPYICTFELDVLCFNENTKNWSLSTRDEWVEGLTYCIANDIILKPRTTTSSPQKPILPELNKLRDEILTLFKEKVATQRPFVDSYSKVSYLKEFATLKMINFGRQTGTTTWALDKIYSSPSLYVTGFGKNYEKECRRRLNCEAGSPYILSAISLIEKSRELNGSLYFLRGIDTVFIDNSEHITENDMKILYNIIALNNNSDIKYIVLL